MACRCVDIDKYERDINFLREAQQYADRLRSNTEEVRNQLSELSMMYTQTVNAQADLPKRFEELDKNAVSNSQVVCTKLEEAVDRAMAKLEKLMVEDEEFHHGAKKKKPKRPKSKKGGKK